MFGKKFMDKIKKIAQIMKKPVDEAGIVRKEQEIMDAFSEINATIFCEVLNQIEEEVLSSYLAQGYVKKQAVERTIQFPLGPVTYIRTPVTKNGSTIYPIDQLLGIEPYERYSKGTQYLVYQLNVHLSYRNSATALEITCPCMSIGKDTVGRIVSGFKESYKEYETYEEEYGELENREVDAVYIEGDGLFVSTQDGMKKEIAHFVVHEGAEKTGKRKQLVEKKHFVGESHQKTLQDVQNYLYRTYDLRETIVITNSDGGKGYTNTVFQSLLPAKIKRHEHFLDRYHVTRKLEERVFVAELIPIFQKAINGYSFSGVSAALDTLESYAETDVHEKHIRKLRAYLRRNWKFLKPYEMRELPGKKEGIGIMESEQRYITYRMKGQGKHWGGGLEATAKSIACWLNGTLRDIFQKTWRQAFALDDRLKQEQGKTGKSDYFHDEQEEPFTPSTYRINYNRPDPATAEKMKWYSGYSGKYRGI